MRGGNCWILYHKTNIEASTVLCPVVKHLGSGRALKKWGKTLDFVSCFPLHFLSALPLPACFTTEQSTVEASLFLNSSVLPTYQMVYCAGKPIERVVYRFYEITMGKACQWEENLLYLRDQVAYSHQIDEMTRQTNHSDWKNESTDSAPDTKSAEQSRTKTSHAKKVLREERKRLSVKGKKHIN